MSHRATPMGGPVAAGGVEEDLVHPGHVRGERDATYRARLPSYVATLASMACS